MTKVIDPRDYEYELDYSDSIDWDNEEDYWPDDYYSEDEDNEQ